MLFPFQKEKLGSHFTYDDFLLSNAAVKRLAKERSGFASPTSTDCSTTGNLNLSMMSYKKKETIPNQALLTHKEKDKLLEKLRASEILEKISYCPECMGWVCLKCWNMGNKLCKKHSKALNK